MILTVLGYAAVVIATLGVIALGLAVAARIQPEITNCQRSRLTLGALVLMALTVMCSGLAAQGKTEVPASKISLKDSRTNKQNWAVTLKQLKTLKAKIASIEQFA